MTDRIEKDALNQKQQTAGWRHQLAVFEFRLMIA
jgi:hypothetical protein